MMQACSTAQILDRDQRSRWHMISIGRSPDMHASGCMQTRPFCLFFFLKIPFWLFYPKKVEILCVDRIRLPALSVDPDHRLLLARRR
jgi:hypothetical protein